MIKPIDEIPQSTAQKLESYRERIRCDIREAMEKGITKFEFVGDYNYKYLAQYARKEAEYIWRKMYMDIIRQRYPEWQINAPAWWEMKRFCNIKISAIKGDNPGEKRVFCEIGDAEKMKKELIAECDEVVEERAKRYQRRNEKKMMFNDEMECVEIEQTEKEVEIHD